MQIVETKLPEVYLIDQQTFRDSRGDFFKTYHMSSFNQLGLQTKFTESFFSTSKKDVIRGMHFQLPPYDHDKIVTVFSGKILDVVLDLREGNNFGKYISVELSEETYRSIYIPRGCAHGFLALEKNVVVNYMTMVF